MVSLKDRQLLMIVSRLYQKQQESFSRKEIMKQMNQVKYLSKQKKLDSKQNSKRNKNNNNSKTQNLHLRLTRHNNSPQQDQNHTD